MTSQTGKQLLERLSLGVQSDYVVNHHEVELLEVDGAIAIRTPTNPDYYFGNYLALTSTPMSCSRLEWEQRFDQVFADLPEIDHRTFVWSKSEDDSMLIQAFVSAGYHYEVEDVLELKNQKLFPLRGRLDPQIDIRPFSEPSDWQQWLQISVALREPDVPEEGFLEHRQKRLNSYLALRKRQLGSFYGAFFKAELIGYAGVFQWQGVARFQDVRVVPGWQNRGIARQLLHRMATDMQGQVDRQVIMADADYHATALYQSMGFRKVQQEARLYCWPRS